MATLPILDWNDAGITGVANFPPHLMIERSALRRLASDQKVALRPSLASARCLP